MIHIGAGGWAFFKVPGLDPLNAYSKSFDFVEVNSTFYTIPNIEMVRSWRRRVPENFVFSVRGHRDLTHKYFLSPFKESYDLLDHSLRICKELKAEILLIQTPATFNPEERLGEIRDFLSSANFGNIRLAWEIRNEITSHTIDLMNDLRMIHCTDISREMPAVDSSILYSRLFGHGVHNLYQFDDVELMQIDSCIKEKNPKKTYITFHGSKMYKDAARMKIYQKTGIFPGITKKTGLESLQNVLEEDARFPATKDELMAEQSWKVFDRTSTEHVHASTVLNRLPDKKYNNIEEVISALK